MGIINIVQGKEMKLKNPLYKKIRKQTLKWKTKDGRKIRICDMEDNHLINAARYLEREAAKYSLAYFQKNKIILPIEEIRLLIKIYFGEKILKAYNAMTLECMRREIPLAEFYSC